MQVMILKIMINKTNKLNTGHIPSHRQETAFYTSSNKINLKRKFYMWQSGSQIHLTIYKFILT